MPLRLEIGEQQRHLAAEPCEVVRQMEPMLRRLIGADVAVSPDPANDFNEHSTMNKTLEYMATGLPVVAFEEVENRANVVACLVAKPILKAVQCRRQIVGYVELAVFYDPRQRSHELLSRQFALPLTVSLGPFRGDLFDASRRKLGSLAFKKQRIFRKGSEHGRLRLGRGVGKKYFGQFG